MYTGENRYISVDCSIRPFQFDCIIYELYKPKWKSNDENYK